MSRSVCEIGREYLPASFNGVPFECLEANSEHGRRGAEGEFPFGENTAYADLGRRIRVYTLTGVIRDDDHVLMAAALIAACEIPGPGILVHPTRGIINAACRTIRVSDRIEEEAGVTHLDLEFVEGNLWSNSLSLVGSVLGLALGTIIDVSSTSFTSRYEPKQVSPVRRDQTIDVGQHAVQLVADAYERAIQTESDDKKWRALYDLRTVQEDNAIASDPEIMDKAITLGMSALASEIESEEKFNTFRSFANWAAKPITLPGLAGESEDAVYSHVRIQSAAYMAQGAVEINYARISEAMTHLDSVISILDEEIINARDRCDNELYIELENFKVQVQTMLYRKTYNLPKLVEYNFNSGIHPLVAAYSLYGNSKRHRELELRNIIDANGRIGPYVVAATA